MKWFDNLNLGPKIVVALVLVAAVPLIMVGGYSASVTEKALIEATVRDLELLTHVEAARVEAHIEGIRSDVLFLSRVPPIQGIVRARNGGGFDSRGRSSYAQWVDRLNVIFSRIGETKPEYVQLRYLDEAGNEMVRVDVTDGHAKVVAGDALQNRAATEYFPRAMARSADEIDISQRDINVEHGEIQYFIAPVIRFAVPVFDGAGKHRGLVIISVSSNQVLLTADDHGHETDHVRHVVNNEGYYLSHPNDASDRGRQLGHENTVQDHFREFAEILLRPKSGHILDVDGNVIVHAAVYPDKSDRNHYWKIIETTPRVHILVATDRFQAMVTVLFIAALVAAIGLGVWLTRRWIIGPLVDLVDFTRRFAAGEISARIPLRHDDEIGQLTTAFNSMGRAVQQAQENLEQRVVQRTAEFHDSEKRVRTILDTAMDGIVTIDENSIVQSFNRAAEHMFGYPADKVVGHDVSMLMPECQHDRHRAGIDRYNRTGESTVIDIVSELTAQRQDGSIFPAELAVTVTHLGRGPLFVGIMRDITNRKQAESALRDAKMQAESANAAKSEFLANMSHELRTPLNAIIGFSELIRSEMYGPVDNPKYVEYVHDINDSGQLLLQLINDILDLSKVEAGRLELNETDVDVAAAVHACVTLVKNQAASDDVEIECHVPRTLPPLSADERKFKQILLNMLSNAIKFTPSGGRVTVSAAAGDDGLRLAVADTGIGMTPEDIATAMEPFGQAQNDMSRHQGTGLGLPLTKALVELHGGTFELTSEAGTGTTVTACFPMRMRYRASA